MRFVFYNGTAHGTLGTILIVEDFHLSRLWIIHGNTGRCSHPEETATVANSMVDTRTRERPSTLGRQIVGHLIGIHIHHRHVLRMPYEYIPISHRRKRIDIIGRYLGIFYFKSLKSLLPGIHYLKATAQSTNQQAMVLVFSQRPDILLSQTILRHLVSFPLPVAITGHTAIEGSKIHGSVAHRYAAYHDIRCQSSLCFSVTCLLTGIWIVADDARIIGSAPVIAQLILRDGADITQIDG